MVPDTGQLVAAILNDCWMVRNYVRGGRLSDRNSALASHRQAAIRKLGLTVRAAFTRSEDFEPLLVAIFHGLSPKDDPPF